jgi:flavodoxin
MAKRSLIMYTSWTGNTEKVANRFKKVFEKYGWECDMFKVDHHTDVKNPPFDFADYDFLCVGSPVVHKKPIEELMSIMAGAPLPPSEGGPKAALMGMKMEDIPEKYRFGERTKARLQSMPPGRIVFGPDSKKGVIFATYGGGHLGPAEAQPAIDLLALEMEHIPIQCIGKFSCPGKHGEMTGWHKDLPTRPSERDLLKAEIFMEEVLEGLD